MSKKILAVTGATGAQGGGLVQAIFADRGGDFVARAITRKPDGEKARELAKLGVEVVAADLDDTASLVKAFAGAHGAFCLTNFWEHFSGEKETNQGHSLAKAAMEVGEQHADQWSTFEDTRKRVPLSDDRMPTLHGKYKVPHFDSKGEADHFFTDLGVPTTMMRTPPHWDNLISFGMGPKKGPDGKLAFTLPMGDKKLPGIAANRHRKVRVRNLQARRTLHRQGRRRRRRAPHGRRDGGSPHARARAAHRLQRRHPRRVPVVRFPGRRRSRQHVPVQVRIRDGLLRRL